MHQKSEAPRDTAESGFAPLLADLVARVPGSVGAALVDRDGECVDYTGLLAPFDIKVEAACVQIASMDLVEAMPLLRDFCVATTQRTFVARRLHDNYLLVLLLGPSGLRAPIGRHLAAVERTLSLEASWPRRKDLPVWIAVTVEEDRERRPLRLRVGERNEVLTVLGTVADAGAFALGFRVRLASGAELTLVRELGAAWYADEDARVVFARSWLEIQ